MSNLAILKLKDNLTVYEAGAYLAGVMGVEDKFSFVHIMGLVNEVKLNLYLNPLGLHKHRQPQLDYDQEFEGNMTALRGEQKFTSVYLDSCAHTLHVKAGAEITGDIFVGEPIFFMDDEAIAKARLLENKVFTDRVSTITETLYQSDEDGESFFYIKRKEIDALVAQIQDTHEPEKNEHLMKMNVVNQHAIIELNQKIKVLQDENIELKAQLNTKSKPAKSQLLVIARAYELYSKGKESTHTKAAFNAELRDDNDLHCLSERTINGLLSKATIALDQERKRKQ